MKKVVADLIEGAVRAEAAERGLQELELPPVGVELPREKAFGDYATNIAMQLARLWRDKPRAIAVSLQRRLADAAEFERVEVAGPGFINLTLKIAVWQRRLLEILAAGDDFARLDYGRGRKVLIEYVSANPTGPLHIGHGRGAVVGDVLARLLARAGYAVDREYYVNDAGNQMRVLGRSLRWRYLELLGRRAGEIPEGCYRGEYLKELAAALLRERGEGLVAPDIEDDDDTGIELFTEYAAGAILAGIRVDLELFGIGFEYWSSEKELYTRGKVDAALDDLRRRGVLYEKEGALWFASSRFGDEKDRVVVRSNGVKTYFASDIAYHRDKFERGYDLLIDVWGADHHGYVPRLKAALAALGGRPESFAAILVQLVSLSRGGRPVAMSTRAGEFVTLREVIEEVGRDAARYFFLTRRSDSHLEFDLELAKARNNDNPVYYAQYAHARICSILRRAAEEGFSVPPSDQLPTGAGGRLVLAEELELIKKLDNFSALLESAARTLEPHRLTYYVDELATQFHSYYNRNRVLGADRELVADRLLLVQAIRQVLSIVFGLLGVGAPERM